jgi:hypothetical protein
MRTNKIGETGGGSRGTGITVGKIASKVAGKSLTQAKKNATKIVGKDVSKPGTLEKISQNMTQAEKRALAAKLKEANVKGKKGLNKKPTQASPDKYKLRSKSTGKISTFNPNK